MASQLCGYSLVGKQFRNKTLAFVFLSEATVGVVESQTVNFQSVTILHLTHCNIKHERSYAVTLAQLGGFRLYSCYGITYRIGRYLLLIKNLRE